MLKSEPVANVHLTLPMLKADGVRPTCKNILLSEVI